MSTFSVRSLLLLASACHLVSASVIPGNIGIFGGHRINITQVPFFAKFCRQNESIWCGANIVHERFLVTAGHCASHRNPKEFAVVVGTDINEKGQGRKYEIEKVFVHPKYYFNNSGPNTFDIDYDIAVIKLAKNLAFNERVKPIKMADREVVLKNGDELETVGFGDRENFKPSKYLLAINETFLDHKKCRKILQQHNLDLTDKFICARGERGKGSCSGDSGGPLIFNETLVGLVSYGVFCGLEGLPQAYSSVRALRSFVDDTIKNNL